MAKVQSIELQLAIASSCFECFFIVLKWRKGGVSSSGCLAVAARFYYFFVDFLYASE